MVPHSRVAAPFCGLREPQSAGSFLPGLRIPFGIQPLLDVHHHVQGALMFPGAGIGFSPHRRRAPPRTRTSPAEGVFDDGGVDRFGFFHIPGIRRIDHQEHVVVSIPDMADYLCRQARAPGQQHPAAEPARAALSRPTAPVAIDEDFQRVDELLDMRDEALFETRPARDARRVPDDAAASRARGMSARTLRALWRNRHRDRCARFAATRAIARASCRSFASRAA